MITSILIISACILLITSIIMQNSKGSGIQRQFETANAIIGASKGTRFIEKTTLVLAGVLIVISVFVQ
jgi:preprotein translocase subunit SecG